MYQVDFRERLRVAFVGLGSHAYRNLLPTLTHLPVELVAVCDLDPDRAERVGAQYGAAAYTSTSALYSELELDAVFIAVSPEQHPRLAVEALDAGLHVWLEKPAATELAQVEEMLAARGDKVVVVGLKKAFMPAVTKAKEIVDDPRLGGLMSAYGVYELGVPRVDEDPGSPRARAWLANSCHPLAALLEVCGPAHALRTHRGARGGGCLVLEHTNGSITTLVLAEGTPQAQPHERYTFFCAGSRVDIENNARIVVQRGIPFDYSSAETFAPPGTDHGALVWEAQHSFSTLENKSLFVQGVHAEMLHFCESIRAGKAPTSGSLEFAAHVTEIHRVAIESDGDRRVLTTGGAGWG